MSGRTVECGELLIRRDAKGIEAMRCDVIITYVPHCSMVDEE